MGHIILLEGVQHDLAKTSHANLANIDKFDGASDIRSSYYQKFVKGYGQIARAFTE